jgi:hypothetical protein
MKGRMLARTNYNFEKRRKELEKKKKKEAKRLARLEKKIKAADDSETTPEGGPAPAAEETT